MAAPATCTYTSASWIQTRQAAPGYLRSHKGAPVPCGRVGSVAVSVGTGNGYARVPVTEPARLSKDSDKEEARPLRPCPGCFV
jgi:hypothetical protein